MEVATAPSIPLHSGEVGGVRLRVEVPEVEITRSGASSVGFIGRLERRGSGDLPTSSRACYGAPTAREKVKSGWPEASDAIGRRRGVENAS